MDGQTLYSVKCRFADISVKIKFPHQSFYRFCEGYTHDGETDMEITISIEDVEREREKDENGYQYSFGYLQTLAIYRKFCTEAAKRGVLLFHGSAIAVDGEGYIFSAPSGTGKSTHTAIWRKVLGDKAKMVNDDKPLIAFKEDGIFVYGTPWNGKHRLGENVSVPVKAICFLEQGKENEIAPMNAQDGFTRLLSQSFMPNEAKPLECVLKMVGKLAHNVPLWNLKCNMDDEAAWLSYNTMKKGV